MAQYNVHQFERKINGVDPVEKYILQTMGLLGGDDNIPEFEENGEPHSLAVCKNQVFGRIEDVYALAALLDCIIDVYIPSYDYGDTPYFRYRCDGTKKILKTTDLLENPREFNPYEIPLLNLLLKGNHFEALIPKGGYFSFFEHVAIGGKKNKNKNKTKRRKTHKSRTKKHSCKRRRMTKNRKTNKKK